MLDFMINQKFKLVSVVKIGLASTFLILLLSTSNSFAIVIDGNVRGFAEGYSSGFNVTFDIENGPTGVPGGLLFFDNTAGFVSVGFIIPLIIDDNTYGETKASDWGTKDHFLIGGGGGKSLEGSDKWEIKDLKVVGGDDLNMKLDYIHQFGDKDTGTDFDTRIEKFNQGGKGGTDLDQSKLKFETSLSFNNEVLGLTAFFGSKTDDQDGDPIDSPTVGGLAPTGTPIDYSFDAPAAGWIPEIMYEFELDESALNSTFDTDAFLNNMGTLVHLSPNKLGGNRTTPMIGDPIPEPSTMLLLGIGLVGLIGASVRRRNGQKKVEGRK